MYEGGAGLLFSVLVDVLDNGLGGLAGSCEDIDGVAALAMVLAIALAVAVTCV